MRRAFVQGRRPPQPSHGEKTQNPIHRLTLLHSIAWWSIPGASPGGSQWASSVWPAQIHTLGHTASRKHAQEHSLPKEAAAEKKGIGSPLCPGALSGDLRAMHTSFHGRLYKEEELGAPGGVLLVKRPASAQVTISRFVGSSPTRALCWRLGAWSLLPILCLPLCPSLSRALVSLCLSKMNKRKKQFC